MLDCHHHLWQASRNDYHWMSKDVPVLARDYLLEDIRPELRKNGITGTILVQAAQTEGETDFLLELAAKEDFIKGVVGWLDMDDARFPERLAFYRKNPKFVAVRPMLQDLAADDWIMLETVQENIRHLVEVDFPFEFLTYTRHLPFVIETLRRFPMLRAVIDHLSKPPIADGQLEPWAGYMKQLGEFDNLHCKVSGMVTEADHAVWTPGDLAPYIRHVADCFGPDRLMFGSDWPVCRLAAEYGDVIHAARLNLDRLFSQAEVRKIFQTNGEAFYRLGGAQ